MNRAGATGRSTMSLTGRVVLAVGALLLIGGIVVSIAAFAYGRQAAREAFDRLLVGAANDIAASISIVDGAPVVDLPVSAFELLALAPDDRIAYQVIGTDGAVLTGYEDLPAVPARLAEGTAFFDAEFKGAPARFIRVSRRFAERSLSGSVQVVVGQTLRARNELALGITRNALIVLATAGLTMLGLAVVVVRSALKPLARVADAFAARDPQDLTPMGASVPREAAVMVEAVNGFMRRLDSQVETMRNLISDTAHQLRTPVAALRALADLAAREDDSKRRDMLVGRIHRRTVSLGRLLDQILSRALVIHRLDSARREVVDLRDIVLDLGDSGDHSLIAPGVETRLEIGEHPVTVRADALSLAEAAKNLLSNAVTHGRPPVTIGAGMDNGAARLWVQDSGPGPSKELRARPGDRFTRSAASPGDSSGLGLSIAQAVADAFGGKLELETRADGFRATLALPMERGRP